MINKFRNFMQGRYGVDAFGIFLVVLSCVINLILSIFMLRYRMPIIGLIPTSIMLYAAFRLFSKNINRRAGENRAYMKLQNKVKNFFLYVRSKAEKRKAKKADITHKYFKCKQCKQEVRVPSGKGKIRITCPKCGTKFEKKT